MSGLELVPYRGDADAPRVVSFFAAVHAADYSVPAPAEEAWRAFAASAYNRGGRDFALALAGGAVAGVLTSARIEGARHFRIVVHPAARRRGIARALFGLVERQDPGAPVALHCNCRAVWTAGLSFLAAERFAVVHRDILMHRLAADVPPDPALPPGYTLRTYAGVKDHAAWAALHNEAFADAFSFAPETPESIALATGVPGFALHVAEHAGAAVGFCQIEQFADSDGYVRALAVTPGHRGRGLGRALLFRGVRTLVAAGRRRVELAVFEDNARARALYLASGFVAYDEVLHLVRPFS